MIGPPEYGRDIVDTINAYDKRYLKEKCVWLRLQKLIIIKKEWMIIQWLERKDLDRR